MVALYEARPDAAFIFTTHCDQLRRGWDALGVAAGRRAFLFNLPATCGEAARPMFRQELVRLGRFLGALGGHEPVAQGLCELLCSYALARNSLLDAAADCSAREYAEAVARFHWDGSVRVRLERGHTGPLPMIASAAGAQECPRFNSPEQRPFKGTLSAGVPLALLGGPLPRSRWHLLDSIERAGGRIVLNGTEAGERSLWRTLGSRPGLGSSGAAVSLPTSLDELARAYCAHCTDVFQRPNTRLYNWVAQRVNERGVRGILLWHYVGCDLWRAEAASLRECLCIPVLDLDADESASDLPRTVGRIEAFIESLSNP